MFDAIIVGARCAGAPTAMLTARAGHRVLLLEKAAFPADALGTHFLHPRGAAYLMKWGLWSSLIETNAATWDLHTTTREGIGPLTGTNTASALAECFTRVHGWSLDFGRELPIKYTAPRRKVMDKMLADAAVSSGAEFRDRVTVEGLLWEGDRVVGVRARSKTGTVFEERANVVVGADGRHSFVAREVKAASSHERPRCTFCYWSYWEGLDVETTLGISSPSTLNYRGRVGSAAFPTNDGLTEVLVMGPCEWFPSFKKNVERNYHSVVDFCQPKLAAALRDARRAERILGTVDQPQRFHASQGKGWALVGDAGYSKDQITAIGMTHAFRDAQLLSSAIDDGLSGRAASLDDALAAYEERRNRDAMSYYEFVCRRAECNPPRLEDLRLQAALRGNRDLIDTLLSVIGDAYDVDRFFGPENVAHVLSRADADLPTPAIIRDFDAMTAHYQTEPWASESTPAHAVPVD